MFLFGMMIRLLFVLLQVSNAVDFRSLFRRVARARRVVGRRLAGGQRGGAREMTVLNDTRLRLDLAREPHNMFTPLAWPKEDWCHQRSNWRCRVANFKGTSDCEKRDEPELGEGCYGKKYKYMYDAIVAQVRYQMAQGRQAYRDPHDNIFYASGPRPDGAIQGWDALDRQRRVSQWEQWQLAIPSSDDHKSWVRTQARAFRLVYEVIATQPAGNDRELLASQLIPANHRTTRANTPQDVRNAYELRVRNAALAEEIYADSPAKGLERARDLPNNAGIIARTLEGNIDAENALQDKLRTGLLSQSVSIQKEAYQDEGRFWFKVDALSPGVQTALGLVGLLDGRIVKNNAGDPAQAARDGLVPGEQVPALRELRAQHMRAPDTNQEDRFFIHADVAQSSSSSGDAYVPRPRSYIRSQVENNAPSCTADLNEEDASTSSVEWRFVPADGSPADPAMIISRVNPLQATPQSVLIRNHARSWYLRSPRSRNTFLAYDRSTNRVRATRLTDMRDAHTKARWYLEDCRDDDDDDEYDDPATFLAKDPTTTKKKYRVCLRHVRLEDDVVGADRAFDSSYLVFDPNNQLVLNRMERSDFVVRPFVIETAGPLAGGASASLWTSGVNAHTEAATFNYLQVDSMPYTTGMFWKSRHQPQLRLHETAHHAGVLRANTGFEFVSGGGNLPVVVGQYEEDSVEVPGADELRTRQWFYVRHAATQTYLVAARARGRVEVKVHEMRDQTPTGAKWYVELKEGGFVRLMSYAFPGMYLAPTGDGQVLNMHTVSRDNSARYGNFWWRMDLEHHRKYPVGTKIIDIDRLPNVRFALVPKNRCDMRPVRAKSEVRNGWLQWNDPDPLCRHIREAAGVQEYCEAAKTKGFRDAYGIKEQLPRNPFQDDAHNTASVVSIDPFCKGGKHGLRMVGDVQVLVLQAWYAGQQGSRILLEAPLVDLVPRDAMDDWRFLTKTFAAGQHQSPDLLTTTTTTTPTPLAGAAASSEVVVAAPLYPIPENRLTLHYGEWMCRDNAVLVGGDDEFVALGGRALRKSLDMSNAWTAKSFLMWHLGRKLNVGVDPSLENTRGLQTLYKVANWFLVTHLGMDFENGLSHFAWEADETDPALRALRVWIVKEPNMATPPDSSFWSLIPREVVFQVRTDVNNNNRKFVQVDLGAQYPVTLARQAAGWLFPAMLGFLRHGRYLPLVAFHHSTIDEGEACVDRRRGTR